MKRIKYGVYTLLILLLGIINVDAASIGLSPSKTTIAPGETFSVKVNISGLTNKLGVADYSIKYDASKVEYINATSGQGKNQVINNKTPGTLIVGFFDSAGGSNGFANGTMQTLTFKAKSSSTTGSSIFNISVIEFINQDLKPETVNPTATTTINFYKPSSEAFLKSLTANGFDIKPGFNQNITSYSIAETEKSSITLSGTASAKAKVTGLGTKTLGYGKNTFPITVTSEDGTTKKTYTLTIEKKDTRSKEKKLSNLSIEGHEIDFKEDVYEYKIDLPTNILNLNITATPKDNKAKISGAGKIKIDEETTEVIIEVEAENKDTQEYKIIFQNRVDEQNKKSNLLKSLKINNIEFNLNSEIFIMGVSHDISELDIEALPVSKTAKVTISKTTVSSGINIINITVTDEGLKNKVYKIIVDKDEYKHIKDIKELTSKSYTENLILKLVNKDIILTKEVIDLIKNNEQELVIKNTNESSGLLYSLTINKSSTLVEDKEMNIKLGKDKQFTLNITIPKDITIKYYIGDNNLIGNLYYYDTKTKEYTKVVSEIKDNYITFTSIGEGKYIYKSVEKEAVETIIETTSSILPFLLGVFTGVAFSALTVYLVKNKDLFINKKSLNQKKKNKPTSEEHIQEIKNNIVEETKIEVPTEVIEEIKVEEPIITQIEHTIIKEPTLKVEQPPIIKDQTPTIEKTKKQSKWSKAKKEVQPEQPQETITNEEIEDLFKD